MADTSREERKNKVIGVLNEARSMELHAISQYMNQHYGLDNMDYGELAKNVKLIAIGYAPFPSSGRRRSYLRMLTKTPSRTWMM